MDNELREVGMMRQWLNEHRITDPTKLVTNDELMVWLEPALQNAYARGRGDAAKLLSFARCGDPDCDNLGTIAVRISDDEWEPQQCQWCHEKKELLTAARQSENSEGNGK
jgi:hypothetical protein